VGQVVGLYPTKRRAITLKGFAKSFFVILNMTTTFAPHKAQEEVLVKITKREAILVQKLRKYVFGKFIIHKANGLLVRLEINDSQLIEEDTEIDLCQFVV